MKSLVRNIDVIDLPLIEGEFSMIPFCFAALRGLTGNFKALAGAMLSNLHRHEGTAFLTLHGRKLRAGQTLRRGGPHTDGNYERQTHDWTNGGGGGWKVGENGPAVTSPEHARLYCSETGGIVLASNYESCKGWVGEFDGLPGVGGDCSKIKLNESFTLQRHVVYYGNNHFVHESLPVREDVHRVFARVTLPADHVYER